MTRKRKTPASHVPVSEALVAQPEFVNEKYTEFFMIEEINPVGEDSTAVEVATAPNGKPFLAILEGRGAVAGKVNKNKRLYTPKGMQENVARIADRITKAYLDGADPNNHNIITGEADHPGPFDGPRLQSTATQLIEAKFDGTDVRVKFGLMDTTIGRNMLSLRDYGVPLGVSTRALGSQEVKTMDEGNPFFSQNKDFADSEYAEIGDFTLEAFDLVTHPSAEAYIGEEATTKSIEVDELFNKLVEQSTENQQKITELYNKVCAEVQTNEVKSSSHITEVIDEPVQEPDKMDKAALLEHLKDFTVEDLKELAPDLCKTMEDAAGQAAVDALPAPVVPEPAPVPVVENTELADALRETKAELVATKEIVGQLVSERADAVRKASLVEAIDKAVEGVSYTEACKSFLNEMVKSNPAAKAEDIPDLVKKYVENILPQFPAKPTEEPTGTVKKTSDNGLDEVVRRYSDLGIDRPIS